MVARVPQWRRRRPVPCPPLILLPLRFLTTASTMGQLVAPETVATISPALARAATGATTRNVTIAEQAVPVQVQTVDRTQPRQMDALERHRSPVDAADRAAINRPRAT